MKKSLPFLLSPLLTLGIVFLANPNFGVIDILPDVFGCVFLWLGLTELSYTDSRIDTARGRLLGLALVQAVKLLLTPALFLGNSSDVLAAVTGFGVVEALLTVLIAKDLYGGLSYVLSRRGGATTVSVIEGGAVLAYVFIAAKALLCIIPECAVIFEHAAYDEVTNVEMYLQIAELKPFAHIFNGFITTIVGVAWAKNLCGIFGKARKDEGFVKSVAESYESGYVGNTAGKVSLWLKHSARIFMLALVFYFNMDFGNINILPNFIGTALLLVSLWTMGIPLKKRLYRQFSGRVCILAFALQIGAYVYRSMFVDLQSQLFENLSLTQIIICSVIAVAEVTTFVLISRMAMKIFNGYVKSVCGEKTASLMYSPTIAVVISGAVYAVGYILPSFRGYFVVPQIGALIAVGAIINANVNFVRSSVENPEDNTSLCVDL